MTPTRAYLALSLMLVAPLVAGCQHGSGGGASGGDIAMLRHETDGPLVVHVRSDAFDRGEDIPHRYTAYGENISPILAWSGVPAKTTKSQVVMMEDPDAPDPKPFVHWLVYNIPADATRLPLNVPPSPQLSDPAGAMQGQNSKGSIGYFGPRPPMDDPAHHYHFQVFALDTRLSLSPGASREELIRAMDGHVVAKGELVGTYRER